MTDPGPNPHDTARHRRLVGLKLRALVRDHLGDESVPEASEFAPGAALVHGTSAWLLVDDRPSARLGAAIAWSRRAGAADVHVLAESGTGVLARRAAAFDLPISVWHVDGRELWPAVPEPHVAPPDPPERHRAFEALITAGGAEVVEEFGVVVGEVGGLEVCRVVDDPHEGTTRLEVGVGAHDREAFTMLHGDIPTEQALRQVVEAVAPHRHLDSPTHPLNRLARERLLRCHVVAHPELVGATHLAPAPPPVPRLNLKDPVPCVATGHDARGASVIVVCSVGVDLDLVPYAADARLAAAAASPGVDDAATRLVMVTPARDRVRATEEIADSLRRPAELVSLG